MAGRTAPEPIRPFTLDFTPLRKLRRYHELTQGQVARSAGLHWTTVLRIERGKGPNPSANAVVAIARALGVPMHDLFDVVDDPKGP